MSKKSFGKYSIELSNTDKLLFEDDGITKGDLISYYDRIGPIILPHLKNRPVTLRRYPDGVGKQGFVQQARPDYFPDWLCGLKIKHGGDTGDVEHVLCQQRATLVYLANQGVISLHRWLSRSEQLRRPDLLVFDLDPSGEHFELVRRAARKVGKAMEALGLSPYVMTTGSRGLHVVAPLQPKADFDQVREASQRMARWLAEAHPDELTTEQRKNKRNGRLYLDVMRNAFGQTAVAPYTVRARPGAPVATPLDWSELEDDKLSAQTYNINNIFRRLGQKEDPWASMHRHGISPKKLAQSLSDQGF